MSFYGSVYYQLIDAFYKAAIRNTGKDSKNFLNEVEDEVIDTANGRKGEITFDTGNRWIQLNANEQEGSNAYYNIWHAAPDSTATETFQGVSISSQEEAKTPTKLEAGDYFSTDKVVYDAAGHISNLDKVYFQLPDPDYEVQNLENRVEKTEKDIENINLLNKTQSDNIKQLQDDMSIINPDNINERLDYLETNVANQVEKNVEDIKDLQDKDKSIEEYIGSSEDSNNLKDGENFWNLSKIIGNVEDFQDEFDQKNRNTSLIEVLNQLNNSIKILNTVASLIGEKSPGESDIYTEIREIKERLEILEGKVS